MNSEIFTNLRALKNTLDCEVNDGPNGVESVKDKCLEALVLIKQLSFNDSSPHVQLATRHSIQYLHKALTEIDIFYASYNKARKTRNALKDICAPAHAGLEIILNLNYQ
ncbi:hypothetical protein AAE02nite_37360 [Adhaeribacter aerolatus]|uniref:DUF5618 domain-containing protein n=1 Tax=Adhaeribacter aerolatus TaxID=670289 RepID=A0A512B289_9BACT|nr:hypothetical protein [Adhaeribacter aerolatus]GEO06072.1 hypothetical protein AAE02nite_37360 [Adhaeribacter aerolatus]